MTVKLAGRAASNYFAQLLIAEYGPFEALEKTVGPMHKAVIAAIRALSRS